MPTYQDSYKAYLQKPQEGEIDLVATVRTILQENGLGQNILAYDSNLHIQQAIGKNQEAQRYILNRFWNIQLLDCSDISIDERYCLIPNGTIQEWLNLFKTKVLPFCIKNNLPKAI